MKRTDKCYLILGLDNSVLHRPYWWRENAKDDLPRGCRIVRGFVTYDDGKKKARAALAGRKP